MTDKRPIIYKSGEIIKDGDLVGVSSRGFCFLAYVDSLNLEDEGLTLVEDDNGTLKFGSDVNSSYAFDAWGWDDVFLVNSTERTPNKASFKEGWA